MDFSQAVERLDEMVSGIVGAIPHIVAGLLTLLIILIAAQLAGAAVQRVTYRERRRGVSIVLGRLVRWFIDLLGVLAAATIIFPDIQPADIIGLLSVLSVALGLAFREILQNYVAGILILMGEQFHVNDQIRVGDLEGTIQSFGAHAALVRTYDGRLMVVPNGDLMTKAVTVITAFDRRRIEYDLVVDRRTDLNRAKRVILDAIKGAPEVLERPQPDVLIVELSDRGVTLRARWWVSPPKRMDVLDARDQVLHRLNTALLEHDIQLKAATVQVLNEADVEG